MTADDMAALVLVRWLLGSPVRAGVRGGTLFCDWTKMEGSGYGLWDACGIVTVSAPMETAG